MKFKCMLVILCFITACFHHSAEVSKPKSTLKNETPSPEDNKTQKTKTTDVRQQKKVERDQKKLEKKKKYIELGNQYATDGLYREAVEQYKRALRIDRGDLESHRMLGIVYVKIGRYRLAIRHLEFIIDDIYTDFEANYYLAEAYRTQDRYGDAIFRYKVALSSDNNNQLALKALAWSYYKIRYYRAALSTINKLEKTNSNDVQVAIIMARVLNKMGYHKKALNRARQQLLNATKFQLPYLKSVIGDIYLSSGDLAKAEESFREALKDQPLLAGALLGLAKILLQQGNRVDIAISYLQRAIRIKPGLVEVLYYLGKAMEKTNPASAKEYFQKFTHRASGDPEYSHLIFEAKKLSGTKNQGLRAHPNLEELESQL